MLVSIVIRTLNEEKYLDELLGAINFQEKDGFNSEVVIVDSGSTDKTLEIARKYNSRVTYIDKKEFSSFSNNRVLFSNHRGYYSFLRNRFSYPIRL